MAGKPHDVYVLELIDVPDDGRPVGVRLRLALKAVARQGFRCRKVEKVESAPVEEKKEEQA